MIALFVTALTSTAIASVAVRAGPQLETSAYRTSQDNETGKPALRHPLAVSVR